jgi:hypothetical protein
VNKRRKWKSPDYELTAQYGEDEFHLLSKVDELQKEVENLIADNERLRQSLGERVKEEK